ncbi:Uncharacterised protein [Streptococcus pneumoniae]|nr:Uncharacterised protein [Streptococcus pneumoniae]
MLFYGKLRHILIVLFLQLWAALKQIKVTLKKDDEL